MLFASLLVGGLLQAVPVLLDSDADGGFSDTKFAVQLSLPKIPLQDCLEALTITRTPPIQVTHVTSSKSLNLSSNHQGEIVLDTINSAHERIVLGHSRGSSNTNHGWAGCTVESWSEALTSHPIVSKMHSFA